MIITFFRSSSLAQYVDMCQQQYFITYVLGQPSPANMKADMGSAGHLALEWLAMLKVQYDAEQEKLSLKTGAIDVEYDRDELYTSKRLTDKTVDKINTTRKNKKIYLPNAKLEYGQVRYGVKVVNELINYAYKHFSEVVSPNHPWSPACYKQVWNCVWMALEQNNRAYDPRFREIVAPEQKFEIEIKKDWAKYEYDLDGQKLKGYLGIKGTIDLVTKVDEDTLEIIDWKFGRMYNFGKDKPKTYEDLQEDIQLMLYYYAAKNLYPDKNVMITINFIRDGGAQTLIFDQETYDKIENILREKFIDIKNNENPKLIDPTYQDHRCKFFCPFYKKKVDGEPYCKYIKDRIQDFGIQYVTEEDKREGFTVGTYEAPGE